MATDKLTTKRIEKLRREALEGSTGLYLWDTELKGFGCRASPSGAVSWLFQRWKGGKGGSLKREVMGQSPGMGIDDARKKAEALRGDDTWASKPVQSKVRVQRERIDLQTPTVNRRSNVTRYRHPILTHLEHGLSAGKRGAAKRSAAA